MKRNVIKQRIETWLARHPLLYLALLRRLGRGSREKRLFLAVVRAGDVVFDIGANVGYYTALFSKLAGPQGEVHAFEPVPETYRKLANEMAGARNAFLNHAACCEAPGAVILNVPNSDLAQASMRIHRQGSWTAGPEIDSVVCDGIELDSYARGAFPNRLDFLKCDVEGAELPALKGMARRLAILQPLLFLEACSGWTRNFGYCPADLISFLEPLGYDRFISVGAEPGLPDARLCFAQQDKPIDTNLLCAVSAKHRRRLENLHRI